MTGKVEEMVAAGSHWEAKAVQERAAGGLAAEGWEVPARAEGLVARGWGAAGTEAAGTEASGSEAPGWAASEREAPGWAVPSWGAEGSVAQVSAALGWEVTVKVGEMAAAG